MRSKAISSLLALLISISLSRAEKDDASRAYLFTSFRGNGDDGLRFLYSFDAYHWTNAPGTFLKPGVGPSKLMRDPSLLRGPDGTFHVVWTTGWHTDQGFGYASSKDLIHWSDQKFVPVMQHEPATVNVWAPELFYDQDTSRFLICWASTIPGRFPDFEEPHTNNHRLYYTTTRDFREFAPTKLFFDPGFSVIDGFIVKDANRYVLIHKDNSRPHRNLRVAFGESAAGPWRDVSKPLTPEFTEGPAALKIGGEWIIYYDAYRAKRYGAAKTADFKTFTDISQQVSFPEGHKHGTALQIEKTTLNGLLGISNKSAGKKPGKTASPKSPEEAESDYTRSIEGRTSEILAALKLDEAATSQRVHDTIIAQYRALRAWHDTNDARLKFLNKDLSKADKDSQPGIQGSIEEIGASLQILHRQFLSKLAQNLASNQIATVKDKMTYDKVRVTYDAYCQIIPNLTQEDKARILELLKEAREEAMDCGSAEEKSAVFKKYKGKINNYLSRQGHDVNKAYKDWGAKQKQKQIPNSKANPAESPKENRAIDERTMQSIYEEVKTPFKYGIILRGSTEEKVDCPNIFHHGSNWFMIYIAFDGSGYETRLARSSDLLHWKPLGPILRRHGSGWDAEQAAGGLALIDSRWDGTWELQPFEGKYWLSYIGGAKKGYETPPLSVGLATTDDPSATKEWLRPPQNPALTPRDRGARTFERDTLFKSHVVWDKSKTLGKQFVMFYNARAPKDSERIGIAVSQDMTIWEHYGDGPVLENASPAGLKHGVISGDPQIVKMGDLWVMFYFGAFWKPGAFDTFAASRDLVHWIKWTGADLISPSEPWDKEFAHKPWIVRDKGVVYHFYCAVGTEGRVIAVATSVPKRET